MKNIHLHFPSVGIGKALIALLCFAGVIALFLFIIASYVLYNIHTSEPGLSIPELFKSYDPLMETLSVIVIILFIGAASLLLYCFLLKHISINSKQIAKIEPPLLGAAKDHEQPIIEMLKSIARPDPGTNKLNRANTVHFIRTLNELKLIDPNVSNKHLVLWLEQVTGYEEKSLSAFGQAMDKQKDNPKLVAEYRKQLEQILAE